MHYSDLAREYSETSFRPAFLIATSPLGFSYFFTLGRTGKLVAILLGAQASDAEWLSFKLANEIGSKEISARPWIWECSRGVSCAVVHGIG